MKSSLVSRKSPESITVSTLSTGSGSVYLSDSYSNSVQLNPSNNTTVGGSFSLIAASGISAQSVTANAGSVVLQASTGTIALENNSGALSIQAKNGGVTILASSATGQITISGTSTTVGATGENVAISVGGAPRLACQSTTSGCSPTNVLPLPNGGKIYFGNMNGITAGGASPYAIEVTAGTNRLVQFDTNSASNTHISFGSPSEGTVSAQ